MKSQFNASLMASERVSPSGLAEQGLGIVQEPLHQASIACQWRLDDAEKREPT